MFSRLLLAGCAFRLWSLSGCDGHFLAAGALQAGLDLGPVAGNAIAAFPDFSFFAFFISASHM